ncbi:MAG TPA: STAS domain-containing protein [Streptosporangiaceae bacterium]
MACVFGDQPGPGPAMAGPGVFSAPHLMIIAEHHPRRPVLRLLGELDLSNKALLQDVIGGLLEQRPQMLVLDLSGLAFMDCSGLSVLVSTRRHLAEDQRSLFVTGAQPIVRRLIALAGLDVRLHLSTRPSAGPGADQVA